MVERQVSTRKYVVAAIITLMIFSLGLLLGLLIEGSRVSYIDSKSREQNIEFNSIQLQYAYLEVIAQEKNCEAVYQTFQDNLHSLDQARIRLENFDKDSKISDDEFNLLKREYILAQIKYWLLSVRTKQVCKESFASILYFFSDEKECPLCDRQAFVLTYLKKKFADNILIFSFDAKTSNEPMVDLLVKAYGITEFPSLVVEGQMMSGFSDKEDILARICPVYNNSIDDCKTLTNSTG